MNPFEQHMQSLADLWNQSGKAFVTAEQSLFSGIANWLAEHDNDAAPRHAHQ
jgi:hypothetical protein